MSEVDKFKRRVIRAVSRLLRKDKTPGEEMWKALRNEAGCDCKLLWQRMRALTLKKMKRLIVAEDRLENIAAVAQMTLTDWLLFDLVLVHEDIDVIGQDLKTEPQTLTDLFKVVTRFQIEGKQGEALATAWTAATFYYNSFGRQCSPMLLQRRWYQLKKLTRTNFYKFWYEFRGNARLLPNAKEFQPTRLQSEIAQRYPHIVTKPFIEWDKMIKEKYVILPEEFEAKIKKKPLKSPKPATNEPDVVLVEPQIETIDLGVDSENEDDPADENNKNSNPKTPVTIPSNQMLSTLIKKEPTDFFEMDFEDVIDTNVLENTIIPEESNRVNNSDEIEIPTDEPSICNDMDITAEDEEINTMPKICSVLGNFNEDSATSDLTIGLEDNRDKLMDDINNLMPSSSEDNSKACTDNIEEEKVIAPPDAEKESVLVTPVSPKCNEIDVAPMETVSDENAPVKNSVEVMSEVNSILECAIQEKSKSQDEQIKSSSKPIDIDECVSEIVKECTEASDPVIELDSTSEDQDSENVDENSDKEHSSNVLAREVKEEKDKFRDNIPDAIDIPADLAFDDDGIELVDDGIAFEEGNDFGAEKNCSLKSENSERALDNLENNEETPKFDLKLLMHPCVYTIKLEDMTVFRNKKLDHVKDKGLLEAALVESKIHVKMEPREDIKEDGTEEDISKEQANKAVNSENNDSDSSDSDDGIPENKKVKPSSYMLQKPKSRTYSPIQLCKNPDFNTRLKRLTVGFLSSSRNRVLLKCLKPMTIDVSKAFESKLINGTVYLKSHDGLKIKEEKVDEVSEQPSVTAVMPSAMPVQSLIDNTNLSLQDILIASPKPMNRPYDIHSERQKTIKLPDINNVRRINQQLLTAEVTPMRIQSSERHIPPVHLVPSVLTPKANPQTNFDKNPEIIEPRIPPAAPITPIVTNLITKEPNPETAPKTTEISNTDNASGPSTAAAPAEKTRKWTRPVAHNLSWNKVRPFPYPQSGADEFLLTLDALNKMLHLFSNEEDSNIGTKTKRQQKKTLAQQKMELQVRMDQYERRTDDPENEAEEEQEEEVKEKPKKPEKKMNLEPPPPVSTPKINIVTDKPYAPYCCWARNKLESTSKKAVRAHQCPRLCQCCCRDLLVKKLHPPLRSETIKKPSTIVISDDEDSTATKKMTESIENVVQHTKPTLTAAHVQIVKDIDQTINKTTIQSEGKFRTEVSIQCDIDTGSDFGKMNLTSVVAAVPSTSHKVPQQSSVKTIKDAKITNFSHNRLKTNYKLGRVQKYYMPTPAYQPPIAPRHQGHITIDASRRKLQIHSQPVTLSGEGSLKEKILYLNNNQKSTDANSPIFLGENKILLTDVKFPSKDVDGLVQSKTPARAQPVTPSAVVAPTTQPLLLPEGVQLIMLPDGQLTYSIDPSAKLSNDELVSLPIILDAVKQQLNATNTQGPSEVIDLAEKCDTTAPLQVVAPAEQAQADVSDKTDVASDPPSEANVQPEGDKIPTVEQKPGSVTRINLETPITLAENLNENQLRDIQAEKQPDGASTNDVIATNSDPENIQVSKDIAENMSAENATNLNPNPSKEEQSSSLEAEKTSSSQTALPTGEETVKSAEMQSQASTEAITESTNIQENSSDKPNDSGNSTANTNRKSLLSDLMEMSGISEEDIQINVPTVNEITTVQPDVEAVPTLAPILDKPLIPSAVFDNPQEQPPTLDVTRVSTGLPSLPELTPITSFSQLKYACENNGRFFKLDLQNGTLSKITVCIKKNHPKLPLLRTIPKSVIDLTEDQDADLGDYEWLPPSIARANRSLLKRNNPKTDAVKPLKLFRAVRILKNKKDDHQSGRDPAPSGTIHSNQTTNVKQKRKQHLDASQIRNENQPRTTQEEVDESSLDSTELDQYIWKDSDAASSVESGQDTSDDEPLAKKAKRMRVNENDKDIAEDDRDSETARPETSTLEKTNEHIQSQMAVDEKEKSTEGDVVGERNMEDEDMADEADITGVEEVLQDLDPMDEDEEDGNCILGV